MSASPAPWTRRVLEVLADGDWHTYDELVTAAGPLVPPGRAARRAEASRAHCASRNGVPAPADRAVAVDEVAVGRRSIVVGAINGLRSRGQVEVRDRRARLVEK